MVHRHRFHVESETKVLNSLGSLLHYPLLCLAWNPDRINQWYKDILFICHIGQHDGTKRIETSNFAKILLANWAFFLINIDSACRTTDVGNRWLIVHFFLWIPTGMLPGLVMVTAETAGFRAVLMHPVLIPAAVTVIFRRPIATLRIFVFTV